MGKAVYVLNKMPESCLRCYFSEDFDDEEQMESRVVCTLPMMDGRDLSKFTSERPSWCPLKELQDRLYVSGWISVEDRLPEKEACVLVTYNGFYDVAILDRKEVWRGWGARNELFNVAYWMPLPEPPKED